MGLKKKAAVFTIVQNELPFLKVWHRHYAKSFANRDIYVLDHDTSDDECLEHLVGFLGIETDVNVIPVHWVESFCHAWLLHTVQLFQQFLLQSYECVLFAEVDEIVHPFPEAAADLEDYLDKFLQCPAPWVRCAGFEVVHDVNHEPPIGWDKNLLWQRKWWSPSKLYSKPLLSKVPLRWEHGFHNVLLGQQEVEWGRQLALLHLHRLDYDYARLKHKEQARRHWSPEDKAQGRGFQNRLADPDQFFQWFYHPETMGLEKLDLQEVPIFWKGVL